MQWMRPRFLPEHLEHLNAGRLGRLGTIRLLHLLFVAILNLENMARERERERERDHPKIRRKIISQAVVFHFYVSGEVNHAKTACFGQNYDRDQPAADSFWFNPVAFCGHTWLHCEMGQ